MGKSVDEVIEGMAERIAKRLADAPLGDEQEDATIILAELSPLKGLIEAAQKMRDKLDIIHADPRYQSVWSIAQIHVGPYEGPNYVDELDGLRASLAALLEDQ